MGVLYTGNPSRGLAPRPGGERGVIEIQLKRKMLIRASLLHRLNQGWARGGPHMTNGHTGLPRLTPRYLSGTNGFPLRRAR